MHEAKLAKMEAEMKMVFQQKVQEKEAKLKQSEEELYARHKDMKDALEKQRLELEEKKRKIESGRPLTPEKNSVSHFLKRYNHLLILCRHGGRVSSAVARPPFFSFSLPAPPHFLDYTHSWPLATNSSLYYPSCFRYIVLWSL